MEPFTIIKRSHSPVELARSLYCSSLMHSPVRIRFAFSLYLLLLSSSSSAFFSPPVTAALTSPLAPALDPLPSFFLQPIENSRHTRNRFLFRSLAGGNVTHPPRFHSLFDLCSALSSGFFRFFFLLVLLFPDHALVNIHTNETFSLSRLAPSKREKSLSRSLG